MDKLEEVERKLLMAIAHAKASGFPVGKGSWGLGFSKVGDDPATYDRDEDDCLCPMGCVVLGRAASRGIFDPEADAAKVLGIMDRQVTNFIVGFDGMEDSATDYDEDEFYDLGVKFREEVV